jgi:hypothetical protein
MIFCLIRIKKEILTGKTWKLNSIFKVIYKLLKKDNMIFKFKLKMEPR